MATTNAANNSAAFDDPKTTYENAKKDLIAALQRKRQLDKQLMELETQIYNSETNYIVETAGTGGNILQGFENYLKAGTSSRKRVEILESDRIFSHSSSSAQRSLNRLEDDSAIDDQYGMRASGTPGIQTVSIAPATRAQEAQAAQKRERDRLYQRKKRASMRQSTISDDGEALPPRKRRKFMED